MALPPIHALTRSLQLLRAELGPAQGAPAQRTTGQPSPAAAAPSGAGTLGASAISRLPGKIRALKSAEGRGARAKVLRAFVEAALLDEFGSQQQLDPAFAALVEKTCQALESSTEGEALVQQAVAELLDLVG